MASPLAHLAAGYVTYKILEKRGRVGNQASLLRRMVTIGLFLVAAMLPDIDSVVGIAAGDLGKYHNQFTHSLFFGCLVSLAVAPVLLYFRHRRPWQVAAVVLFSYAVHLGLDWVTHGRGIKFFWPFLDDRFLSPVQVFYGVKWSDGLFSKSHFITIANEAGVLLLVFLIYRLWRGTRKSRRFVS